MPLSPSFQSTKYVGEAMTVNAQTMLEPCPFCGGKAAIAPIGGSPGYWVQCSSCGSASSDASTPEWAAKRWNTRSPAIAGVAARLLAEWADDFEAAAHEVPKGIKSTVLMTRAQECRTALAALPPSQEVPAQPQADVREAWSCGTCGDRDVPQKFRVFGSCYKCAAQRSINTRNRKIERLRALASEGEKL